MLMSRKKNEKLLVSLSKYYIALIITITLIIIISYFALAIISNIINNDGIAILNAITDSNLDYKDLDEDQINEIGAYIEILDREGNVIDSVGKNKGVIRNKYSKEELLKGVVSSKENSGYLTLVNKIKYNGTNCYAVVNIPSSSINVGIKLNNISSSISKPVLITYVITIVIALFLTIMCVIIYSVYTTRKIKKPLDNINNLLSKITEGNYDERINEDNVYEFKVISDTINYLTEKLKNSKEENKRLKDTRDRMLLDLSHDIKTPITSIKGFSQALYEGMVNDENKKIRYYKAIYTKSERVSELVDDLFEFVRLDKVKYTIKLENIDICEYIRQIVLSYYDEIENKGFELLINIPDEPIMLKIDTKLFKRVIVNLIENSLKYNIKGTKLRIEVRDFSKFVAIEIADNGIGIEESIADNVFEAFVRADKSRKSTGGSGLGLSIAKKIVESHGGQISLLRSTKDEKTIFCIKMYKDI